MDPDSLPADPAGENNAAPADELVPRSRNASARAVALNALSSYASLFVGAGLGLVSTRNMLERMGDSQYGTWSLLVATVGYIGLLEAGFGSATTNRIAAVESEGDDALQEVVSTSLVLCALVASAALLVALAVSFAIPSIFTIAHASGDDAILAFAVLGLAQAMAMFQLAFTAFLLGTGRMYMVNLGEGILSFATTAAQAGIAVAHGSLTALAIASSVGLYSRWRCSVIRSAEPFRTCRRGAGMPREPSRDDCLPMPGGTV